MTLRLADPDSLAVTIAARQAEERGRILVALAGPPATGKSTLADALAARLPAAVVPMDGFHYDDAVLLARGHRDRKGAPHTFDAGGLSSVLHRLLAADEEVAVPVFDRALELSRNAARIVPPAVPIILVEGNWLLLDEDPWSALRPLFDLTVLLHAGPETLESRLLDRWLGHGRSERDARRWIESNDRPNILKALDGSARPDILYDTDA